MVGKILLAILLGILLFAGIAAIGALIALMIFVTGDRSIDLDVNFNTKKNEKDADTD